MNDEAGFLDALARGPADATARMAFADWLQDRDRWTRGEVTRLVCAHKASDGVRQLAADWYAANGEADRAEFIRVQVEESALDCAHAQFGPFTRDTMTYWNLLRERERELLEEWDEDEGQWGNWLPFGPFVLQSHRAATLNMVCEFRRGFIESVSGRAADWLEHGDALLAEHPIASVRLRAITDAALVELGALTTRRLGWSLTTPEGASLLDAFPALWPGIAFELPTVSGTGGTATFGGHAIPVGSWSIAPGGTA